MTPSTRPPAAWAARGAGAHQADAAAAVDQPQPRARPAPGRASAAASRHAGIGGVGRAAVDADGLESGAAPSAFGDALGDRAAGWRRGGWCNHLRPDVGERALGCEARSFVVAAPRPAGRLRPRRRAARRAARRGDPPRLEPRAPIIAAPRCTAVETSRDGPRRAVGHGRARRARCAWPCRTGGRSCVTADAGRAAGAIDPARRAGMRLFGLSDDRRRAGPCRRRAISPSRPTPAALLRAGAGAAPLLPRPARPARGRARLRSQGRRGDHGVGRAGRAVRLLIDGATRPTAAPTPTAASSLALDEPLAPGDHTPRPRRPAAARPRRRARHRRPRAAAPAIPLRGRARRPAPGASTG